MSGYLTGPEILRWMEDGRISIDPFDPVNVGPNGVDLHFGDKLYTYDPNRRGVHNPADGARYFALEPDRLPKLREVPFVVLRDSEPSWLLTPGVLYLGRTHERTRVDGAVPRVSGRSSLGRVGVGVHVTAGDGDDGFDGTWTLEITVVEPVLLRPGGRYVQMRVCTQIGERKPYKGRYQGQVDVTPSLGGGAPGHRSW